MNQKIEYLKLSNISDDKKFNLNPYSGIDTLKQSISAIGILYPLLVWKCEDEIILVDGFKRFQIAKNSNYNELPFIMLLSDYTLTDIIKIRYYNLRHGNVDLNALQKISIFKIVEECDISKEEISNWVKILNLSNLDKLPQLLNWPDIAQEYVYIYNVSIKQLRFYLGFDTETIIAIFSFAKLLSIRIVELNRIVEMISEIALNDDLSILSILKDDNITSITNDDQLNRNQKVLKLKNVLFVRRYPAISEYKKRLNDQLRKLSFEENTQIHYDPSFEKAEIILSSTIRNVSDLNKLVSSYSNKSNIESLQNILELL